VRGIRLRWAAFPIAYYGANAVWQGYMSLYYRKLGYSDGRIGLISAITALCALFVQPLWGTLGDRTAKTRCLLAGLAAGSALTLPLALLSDKVLPQIACAILFYGFYCALLPMGDSVLLQGLNREKLPFGPYRLAGAFSFAVTGAVFGWVLQNTGMKSVVWCAAALLLLAAAAALLLPEGTALPRRKIAFRKLFQNQELLLLLGFMIPVQMTMGYFYTFFAPHFAQLKGGNGAMLGLGYAIATFSEVPYLLLCDKIFQRFGAARPMCLSAVILSVRWLLLGMGKTAPVAMSSQLLHGGGFIVMTVSMAKYISRNVDQNLQASGQMLLSMASFGIARVAGNLGGGLLADRIGIDRVFLIASALCFASAAAFARWAFRHRS